MPPNRCTLLPINLTSVLKGIITGMTANINNIASHLTTPDPAQVILDFWFADGLQSGWPTQEMKAIWFGGGPELDALIKTKFGRHVLQAVQGGLSAWEKRPMSRLALILLLDQFTRNVFRGSARAFGGDARSQQLVTDAIAQNWDQQLPMVCRVFLYMPLMHAENLLLQVECVNRFRQLLSDAPESLKIRLQGNLDFAKQHRDIIAQFGRFPHRNLAMGRVPTSAEESFVLNGPRFGQ